MYNYFITTFKIKVNCGNLNFLPIYRLPFYYSKEGIASVSQYIFIKLIDIALSNVFISLFLSPFSTRTYALPYRGAI